jgi:membrane protein DedA with SNARE-associated domain/rhodanese-related sulfurtransferase
MKETVEFLAKHGYWLLFVAVLGRQACLPVPVDLLLLAAGALAGLGRLSFTGIIAFSITAFLLADLTWYAAGRRWGSRTLTFVCGLSQDPNKCLEKITKTFDRHGVKSLLVSKFIIGLDAVAAPMSGVSRISLPRFLIFDGIGAILWSSVYTALGYVFSDQLDHVAEYTAKLGELAVFGGMVCFGVLIIRKLVRWYRFLREFKLARITPDELWEKMKAGEKIVILDLQGGAKQAQALQGMPGAIRIDPGQLGRYVRQYRGADLATDHEVILYCDSPNETRSARVALALRGLGFGDVRPLAGGFRGWRNRGFPITPNVEMLPLAEESVYVLREILRFSRRDTANLLKISASNADQLLKRARKRIETATNTPLLSSKSHDLKGTEESIPIIPATSPERGSRPE